MEQACRVDRASENPGLALGALMAAGASSGRDKLTLLLPPHLAVVRALGRAAGRREHRQAGQGRRADHRRAAPTCGFGDDRVVVAVSVGSTEAPGLDRAAGAATCRTRRCEMPDVDGARRRVPPLGDRHGRGRLLLGINPFDEPNVQQAKDATRALLDITGSSASLPFPEAHGPSTARVSR